MTSNELALRATFEGTVTAQNKLRQLLRELIEEGRPAEDDDERDEFRSLMAQACLGLETEAHCTFTVIGSARRKAPNQDAFGNDEFFVFDGEPFPKVVDFVIELDCKAIEWRSDNSDTPHWARERLSATIAIDELWKKIREKLDSEIFPMARKKALELSPERTFRPHRNVRRS